MQNDERIMKYRRQNERRGARIPKGDNGLTDRQIRRLTKWANRHGKKLVIQ